VSHPSLLKLLKPPAELLAGAWISIERITSMTVPSDHPGDAL
jgi:hypothetical protein